MKISAINNYQKINFTGEKKDRVKNTAAAAMIALASAAPATQADAQIYYPPRIYPYTAIQPHIMTSVPRCFVIGDITNIEYGKSMKDVFKEIDKDESGTISAKELIRAERKNWNATNLYPYNAYQMKRTEAQFNTISELYNEEESNPETINYNEYKAIMNDYMEAKNVNDFLNLMRLFTYPNCPPPHRHRMPPHRH